MNSGSYSAYRESSPPELFGEPDYDECPHGLPTHMGDKCGECVTERMSKDILYLEDELADLQEDFERLQTRFNAMASGHFVDEVSIPMMPAPHIPVSKPPDTVREVLLYDRKWTMRWSVAIYCNSTWVCSRCLSPLEPGPDAVWCELPKVEDSHVPN